MTIKIKHKRGTASSITTANPTLAAGELAFETDTRRFKLGDGTTAWSSLSYVTPYVTATDRILGRSSAGAGAAEEISCGSFGRSLIGSADAAAARTTLSVQPTASPAFTGAATVTNDGNVVPLTVTNTGTANSFVVNDASGDPTPFVIDAAGGVGVGGSPSAIAKVHVLGDLPASASTQGFRMTGEIPSAATATATSYISFPSTQAASFTCAALYHYRAFQGTFGAGSAVTSQFGYHADASLTGATNNYGFYSDIASGTGRWNFYSNGTAPSYFGGQLLVTAGSGSSGSYKPGVAVSGDDDTGLQQVGGAGTISLVTQGSERVRVDASGNVLVGTTNTDPSFNNVSGVAIGTNYISMSRDNVCFGINRSGTDGDIAVIRQDSVTEGSISVSGNTVSYNAFCGSHWAQLIDNSRPSILRGTVLETIDQMCEWPGEPQNDRLPRVKVSDTPGSRRVYGVFMGWDEDDTATGDMYCTALGAYMVRVSGAVQSGDLLESAGDGTARTQPDDIVRSSTIGKVSSTHRVEEYDDGSYLVPCVLMCG